MWTTYLIVQLCARTVGCGCLINVWKVLWMMTKTATFMLIDSLNMACHAWMYCSARLVTYLLLVHIYADDTHVYSHTEALAVFRTLFLLVLTIYLHGWGATAFGSMPQRPKWCGVCLVNACSRFPSYCSTLVLTMLGPSAPSKNSTSAWMLTHLWRHTCHPNKLFQHTAPAVEHIEVIASPCCRRSRHWSADEAGLMQLAVGWPSCKALKSTSCHH